VIDLSYNDVRAVERHAFAWLRRVDVVLGRGRVPLSLDAYSFYGARDMRRVAVAGVPALTLRPRIFTNTHVRDLEHFYINICRSHLFGVV